MLLGSDPSDAPRRTGDPTRGASLVLLSVAVSIDSLAVGLGLSALRVSIWWPALVIGMVACAFTAAGLHLGRVASGSVRISRLSSRLAGLLLLGIGLRILHEHGAF